MIALSLALVADIVDGELAGTTADTAPVVDGPVVIDGREAAPGSLFAAFLGYNPIDELLGPSGVLQNPAVDAEVLTGKTFFPELITEPFHAGLTVVFVAAAVMMLIGAAASMFSAGRYSVDVPGGGDSPAPARGAPGD